MKRKQNTSTQPHSCLFRSTCTQPAMAVTCIPFSHKRQLNNLDTQTPQPTPRQPVHTLAAVNPLGFIVTSATIAHTNTNR